MFHLTSRVSKYFKISSGVMETKKSDDASETMDVKTTTDDASETMDVKTTTGDSNGVSSPEATTNSHSTITPWFEDRLACVCEEIRTGHLRSPKFIHCLFGVPDVDLLDPNEPGQLDADDQGILAHNPVHHPYVITAAWTQDELATVHAKCLKDIASKSDDAWHRIFVARVRVYGTITPETRLYMINLNHGQTQKPAEFCFLWWKNDLERRPVMWESFYCTRANGQYSVVDESELGKSFI